MNTLGQQGQNGRTMAKTSKTTCMKQKLDSLEKEQNESKLN